MEIGNRVWDFGFRVCKVLVKIEGLWVTQSIERAFGRDTVERGEEPRAVRGCLVLARADRCLV